MYTYKRNSVVQICEYLKRHPGSTESELQVGAFGYYRGSGAAGGNKKYAEMLRRGMRNRLIYRLDDVNKHSSARYVYYIHEDWKDQLEFNKERSIRKGQHTRDLNKRMTRSMARCIFHQKLFDMLVKNWQADKKIDLTILRLEFKNQTFPTIQTEQFQDLNKAYSDFLIAHSGHRRHSWQPRGGWSFWSWDRLQKHLAAIALYNPDLMKFGKRNKNGRLYIKLKTDIPGNMLSEFSDHHDYGIHIPFTTEDEQNYEAECKLEEVPFPEAKAAKEERKCVCEQCQAEDEEMSLGEAMDLIGELETKLLKANNDLNETIEDDSDVLSQLQVHVYDEWKSAKRQIENCKQLWALFGDGEVSLEEFDKEMRS